MLRKDLTLLELADAVESLLAEGRTVERIANAFGKARTQINKYRRIARAPESIKSLVRSGQCVAENRVSALIARHEKSPAKFDQWAQSVRESGERIGDASLRALDRFINRRGTALTDSKVDEPGERDQAAGSLGRRSPAKLVPGSRLTLDGRRWTVQAVQLVSIVDESGEHRVVPRSEIPAESIVQDEDAAS